MRRKSWKTQDGTESMVDQGDDWFIDPYHPNVRTIDAPRHAPRLDAAGEAASAATNAADEPQDAMQPETSATWVPPIREIYVNPDWSSILGYLTFEDQWYLQNTRQLGETGMDLNIVDVWADYTGRGVTVAVVDSGVQGDHPDLDQNYRPLYEIYTLPGGGWGARDSGLPDTMDDNHGTPVAGIIAAENNGDGGLVGVAYNATIYSLDNVDIRPGGAGTDRTVEMMLRLKEFDVTNHSYKVGYVGGIANQLWSGSADFYRGIREAAEQGRDGLGTIIVNSSANDRPDIENVNDTFVHAGDANLSNLSNSRYVITVGGVDDRGEVVKLANPGASLLVSAFDDPGYGPGTLTEWQRKHLIATIDRTGDDGYDKGFIGDTTYFGGTSAAAPQVSGVVALMLEANPALGWRDVQNILAYSARKAGEPAYGPNWTRYEIDEWEINGADNWNGGGLHFSNDYGFGVVDALAAVRLAETWTRQSTSLNESMAIGNMATGWQLIPDPALQPNTASAGVRVPFQVSRNIVIERIELDLDFSHPTVSDLVIELISPNGTDSYLLENRGGDWDIGRFVFTSNEFRGELSAGTWTLVVRDTVGGTNGVFKYATLRAYGSEDTTNDLYVYTNEFAASVRDGEHRFRLTDQDGGEDTINAAAVTSASIIDLEGGHWRIAGVEGSGGWGVGAGQDPQFYMIENIIGGDGADELTGNRVANHLQGGRGADRLDGRGGNDTLTGGRDGDTFVFRDGWGDDIVTDFVAGSDVLDLREVTGLIGFNQLAITDTADGARIAFGGNSITLNGVGKADLTAANFVFDDDPGAGDDSFDGTVFWGSTIHAGAGVDTLSYASATSAIYADLIREGGYAEGDWVNGTKQTVHFTSVENLTGATNYMNYLHGDQNDNILIGGESYDWLTGRGGSNTLDGRGAINLADYYETNQSVTIDLTIGRAFHSTGVDTLINIQQFRATNSPDVFIGDGQDNYFHGMNGDDTVNGGAGKDILDGSGDNDILDGGADDDTLTGGEGRDVLVFGNGWGRDIVTDFEIGADLLDVRGVGGLSAFSQLAISDTAQGASIAFGGNSITLNGVSAASLTATSFVFTAPSGQTFDGTAYWGGTIQGTAGVDTVSYANANYSIYVDLLRDGGYAEGLGGPGAATHLSSIENITGSSTLLNYLHGNQDDNVLIGGDHFDWLVGRGGNNTLDGRGWINMADYYETDAPVTIDLTLGRAFHSTGIDTLINIQQFRATNSADVFNGDGQDNYFHGMNGNDTVAGNGGKDWLDGSGGNDVLDGGDDDDRLIGGPDDDVLTGGSGADLFVYNDGYPSADRILDLNAAEGDRIDLTALDSVNSYSDLTVGSDGEGNARLAYGQSSIVFVGIAAEQVNQDLFLF